MLYTQSEKALENLSYQTFEEDGRIENFAKEDHQVEEIDAKARDLLIKSCKFDAEGLSALASARLGILAKMDANDESGDLSAAETEEVGGELGAPPAFHAIGDEREMHTCGVRMAMYLFVCLVESTNQPTNQYLAKEVIFKTYVPWPYNSYGSRSYPI